MHHFLFIIVIFTLLSCSLVNSNKERDIVIDDKVKTLDTFEYLGSRADNSNNNIAVVNQNYDAQKLRQLKVFLELYNKEITSHGWVVLYEEGHNTTNMEALIENNIAIFTKYYLDGGQYEDGPRTMDLYGADIRALNNTINKACGTSFIVEGTNQTVILFTRPDMNLEGLCNMYPVILGINGLHIIEKDNKLYIQKPNKALQLTSNTPLRSVLRSTELKRYV